MRLPGLRWAWAEQLPPCCGGAVTCPLSHCQKGSLLLITRETREISVT